MLAGFICEGFPSPLDFDCIEYFLTSPSFSTLRSAAASGPVILTNHSSWYSDVLESCFTASPPPSSTRLPISTVVQVDETISYYWPSEINMGLIQIITTKL